MKRAKRIALLLCAAVLLPGIARAEPETAPAAPQLISETAVLMDAKTGQVLYNKNMDQQMFPASITKIMTTILAVEECKLTDPIVMSEEAVDAVSRSASHIALTADEQITVEEAIYAALLVSANDACNGIAEKVSGSMDAFARHMTEKAAEFGAKHTHFNNSNGLKDPEHYTTAYDMAAITRHGLQNPTWHKMFGTLRYDMPANNKQKDVRILYNQHSMISDNRYYYKGIIGGKAGYTTAAKYTLVTAAERDGTELIAVVMKSPKNADKYTDTKALLDYGFEAFQSVRIEDSMLPTHTVTTTGEDGATQEYTVSLAQPVTVRIPQGADAAQIEKRVEMRDGVATLTLTLAQNSGTTPQELGSFPLTAAFVPAVAETQPVAAGASVWKRVLLVAGVLFGLLALFVAVIYIRKEIYLRRRRARRRRY